MLSLFWIQASLPSSAVNTLLAWICNVLNYSYWSSYLILKFKFFLLKKKFCLWDQIKGSEYRFDWRSWVLVQTLNSYIANSAISLSLGLLPQAIPPPQHPPLLSGPDFVTLHPHHDMCVCAQSLSRVRLFVTTWTVACQALLLWNSLGKNTKASCHSLLQGIFQTQGSNLSPALAGGFFTTASPGKPYVTVTGLY